MNFVPIDTSKKWMSLDLFNSMNSQSFFRISNQFSVLIYIYLIKSAAAALTLASDGIQKYLRQFWILYQVYLGVSEAKGG